ncbi:hypothetical protein TRV_00804 [Trichophyton verrucosum HKI 0517]|uniref:Uncharacterized protein n=1 Tax=Trichophyton verrucosum (strain HKI 0517) TaxID=663202 RepID=D4D157_TRIVH|nr:uncharacterized protein TRV_00804 [Trichophyton verrucosum HKI 0517]EFE44389.1 hypothetical protein TRV_00804 [Trichophyton verrucosum HKI 0517]
MGWDEMDGPLYIFHRLVKKRELKIKKKKKERKRVKGKKKNKGQRAPPDNPRGPVGDKRRRETKNGDGDARDENRRKAPKDESKKEVITYRSVCLPWRKSSAVRDPRQEGLGRRTRMSQNQSQSQSQSIMISDHITKTKETFFFFFFSSSSLPAYLFWLEDFFAN